MHSPSRGKRILVITGILGVLGGMAGVSCAWALGPGAPPVLSGAWVYVRTNDGAAPRLFAEINVEIPGGRVPQSVASVTVLVPGEQAPRAIPRGQVDLMPDRYYQADLNTLGVVGFPTGTYTFTVTDTAGGTSTVTDTLASSSALGTPTITSHVAEQFIPASPPTIAWDSVPGAAGYRARVRYGFMDQDLFSKFTTATSVTLPSGVILPGRRYQIRVEAFDDASGGPAANAQAVRRIQVEAQGPDVFLSFPNETYTAGQTLDVTARVWNTHASTTVDALVWIGLPGGAGSLKVLEFKDLLLPQGLDWSGSLGFSYNFTGGEPSGVYVVGFRLLDKMSGETIALTTRTFSK